MKISGVIVKDEETDMFFAYVKQFPGICAQDESIDKVKGKIDAYYNSFMAIVIFVGETGIQETGKPPHAAALPTVRLMARHTSR